MLFHSRQSGNEKASSDDISVHDTIPREFSTSDDTSGTSDNTGSTSWRLAPIFREVVKPQGDVDDEQSASSGSHSGISSSD
jgi:hypothetical protein